MENSTKKNCFELYGADFMLTPDLKVKECGRCMRVLGNVSKQMEGIGALVSIVSNIILCFWSAELFFMKKEIQLLNIKENVPFYGQTCLRQDIILKNMHHVR